MRKVMLVATREYLENVRTKGFWLGIFLVPVIYTLAFLVPYLVEKNKAAKRYAVVDNSGWLLTAVQDQVNIQDLARVFQYLADESIDTATLPGPLVAIAPSLIGNESLAPLAASFVVQGSIPEGVSLPAQLQSSLSNNRDSLINWISGNPGQDWSLPDGVSQKRFRMVDPGGSLEDLNRQVVNEELFAYFVIDEDPVGNMLTGRYVSNNLTDDDLHDWFSLQASAIIREKRLDAEQIDQQVATWIQATARFEGRQVSEEGEEEEVEAADKARQFAPIAFVYILWIALFSIVQMLLTNTIEEKSNKLIEVLLSSMTPVELMSGKIAGIAGTGLTMVVTWMGFIGGGAYFLPKVIGRAASLDIAGIVADPIFLSSFVVYFLLGYLFYAAILVGIGSVCNSLKEAQTLMSPVVIVLFLPLLFMVPIGQDPNGILARVLSYFPPMTPFVMMNRAAAPPPTFDYIATTILMVISVVLALWGAAKIFRIGILLTGKPPKLGEIIKWLKAPVGAIPERKE